MRGAHWAFFLDDDEKSRAVELLRRAEDFCGVMVLAYAIISNHFHIFIYVPEPSALEDDDILRRIDAWEAGIVKRPEDYEWCSFAAKRKSNENEDENLKDNLL